MNDDPQPAQPAEELLNALLTSGAEGLETWRMTLEMFDGWVKLAVEHGWPEPTARALVYEQTRANLRFAVLNAEAVNRP